MVLDGAKGEKEEFDENRSDTRGYKVFYLNQDMREYEEWFGQPYLTNILSSEEHQPLGFLYITNYETREKLRARVEAQTAECVYRMGSVGFDLIRSFKKLAGEDVTRINKYTILYSELQEYINSLNSITVKTIPHTYRGIYWKTLEVIRVVE